MKLITSGAKRKEKYLYGNKFDNLSSKTVLSQADMPLEHMDIKRSAYKVELSKAPDKATDMLVFTRSVGNKTIIEIKNLEKIRKEKEFECDAKIISTYEKISNKRDVRKIMLGAFLNEMKEKFQLDIRTAYKRIETASTKNVEYSVYIYHIYALLTATMSIINELDFRPPVYIEMKKSAKGIKLSLMIK